MASIPDCCGFGALFAVMSYLQSQDMLNLLFACALILLAFVIGLYWRSEVFRKTGAIHIGL